MEFVASLVAYDPGLVQLWWPEWLIPGYDWGVKPDHLVVIDTGEASALILVEVDESTERPPVIRDRLRAYAKLFEDHQVGWHLLWVANSRERLARLRQIAGPMKDSMLSGRCWGVAIDDVSDQGADAEVVAIGASLEPRPLRDVATDPKARRSDYEVGSAAWIRLLANGGQQDMNGLWSGIEREQAEPEPGPSPEPAAIEQTVRATTESAASDPDPDQAATREAAPEPLSIAVSDMPELPAAAPNPDEDLQPMFGGELVRLILAAGGEGSRATRAYELLAERGNADYLLDDLEQLCSSREPDLQQRAVGVIRYLRLPSDEALGDRARDLLLRLVDQRNAPAVVAAALATLETPERRESES